MDRLRLERGCFRKPDGTAVYLLGANYWPQRLGPWMYREPWNPDEIGREFAQLAAIGCNVVRVFCFTPDFIPEPFTIAQEAIDRLARMIELAAEHKMWSIPTFLVGHMSGENWEPAWARTRDWHTDAVVLGTCEQLIETIVERLRESPAVVAWLMTNEWPLFACANNEADAEAWLRRLSSAVRKHDPERALSLGDGAWDVISGQPAIAPAPKLASSIDFFGPHFYPKETDALRHSVFASFAMRMTQTFDRPVLLEEFGCSSDQADDRFAADYYRTVMWSAYGAGNCGTLFWNSHDFPLPDKPPYSHHPYELHFGVVRTDGTTKPQADEVARFARFVTQQSADDWIPEAARSAIARTSYYLQTYQFDWGWSKAELRDLLLQSYACTVSAGLDARFVDLSSPIDPNLKLVIVPCLHQTTTQDAEHLVRFVRNGGAVLMSYGGEPWFPDLAPFIGARPLLRYGLVDSPPDEVARREVLSLRFTRDIGNLSKNAVLQIPARAFGRRSAPLRCEPTAADVVGIDADGKPAVLEHRLGDGIVWFVSYPLEFLALAGLDANRHNGTWRFYQAAATARNALNPLGVTHPAVQSFIWRAVADESRYRILLVNLGTDDLTVSLPEHTQAARDLESGAAIDASAITLAAKGVRVIESTAGVH